MQHLATLDGRKITVECMTEEPRFNEPLFDENLDVKSGILFPMQ